MDRFEAEAMVEQYRLRHPVITIVAALGYNPQMLLTDQRGKLKRWADEHRHLFADGGGFKLYPHQQQAMDAIMRDGNEFVIPMGTGRFRRYEPEYQDFPSLMRRREPTFVTPMEVDFGSVEARIVQSMQIKKSAFRLNVDASSFVEGLAKASAATKLFTLRLQEHKEAMARLNDKLILQAIYGDGVYTPAKAEGHFRRERFIARLLSSPDPRRRKRGNRLFDQWRRARPGINFTDPPLRSFYDTNLGEPYDPERYRKD